MMRIWKPLLVFLTLFILVSLSFWFHGQKKEKAQTGNVIIEYDSIKGYSPDRVIVRKGTKVTFKNLSGKDFWPASDFYPTNTNYPELNSRGNIKDMHSWDFTFDTVGVWGYHDDLNPINKGTIVVTEGLIYVPDNTNCRDLDALSYSQRQVCWYGQIKNTIKKQGVDGALKLVSKLYNEFPLFAQGCHDATHLIGDEAYRNFRKGIKFSFSVETSYCGYGFYHGFIEAMLYTTGDYVEVRNFCESVNDNLKGNIEAPNAIYSCYHGIGHSTFDVHDQSVWGDEKRMVDPAIKTCERVTQGLEEEKTKQCITGVFNALGNAYSTSLYNFKMNPKDPTWFCKIHTGAARRACFIEVTMAWIGSTMGNSDYKFLDAVEFIQAFDDIEDAKVSIFSMTSDFVRLHVKELSDEKLLENCKLVKNALFESCLEGTELALLNWGKPEKEYERPLAFCRLEGLDSKSKDFCYFYIFNSLRSLYSKDKRINICKNEVPNEYETRCIN